jgi:DNA-binding NtrC family response regulator
VVQSLDAFKKAVKADKLKWDLFVSDNMIDNDTEGGKQVLEFVKEVSPNTPLVIVVAEDRFTIANELIKNGATDVLLRKGREVPLVASEFKKIERLVSLLEQNRRLRSYNRYLEETQRSHYQMIGDSPPMRDIFDIIQRVGRVPRPVLIKGERGTGKELVARAIHDAGGNPNAPLVTVNCAAFSDELLESALFGHEKGAFTGAHQRQLGKFEQADGGTLFLDEIGNMSMAFQQKIMRVVEYNTMRRVGGLRDIRVNVRIIAATNADLKAKMEAGEFMRDLYDRLTFEIIKVPPLRERKEDIERLANFFLHRFMEEIPAFRGKRLADSTLEALKNHDYPGNIRELKNIIERAVYRDTNNKITPEELGIDEPNRRPVVLSGGFKEMVENFEKDILNTALERAKDNQAQAARDLDLTYHQLRHYLKKYELLGSNSD